ncbi:hypothetical protein MNBD_GAMMA03-276 [hydrothermal vent metagenome]|uniref:Glycosyltransferase 2-like domain-containing protein n=1 Tax=hydrothermal vent metagenome TaxID=652676 RepID=A0A3B0WZ37_9ZZZZ
MYFLIFSFYLTLIILIYVYFGYPILLLVLKNFLKSEIKKDKTSLKCSLIITAFNEELCIEKKIKNSLKLNYPRSNLEIIVALDGCTDSTESIVKRYESQGVVLIKNQKHLGKTFVQFMAVEKAKGEILIFTDANAELEKNSVKIMMENYADSDVGCVCGNLNYIKNNDICGEGLYKKYENFIKSLENSTNSIISAEGSFFSVRKKYYTQPCVSGGEDALLPFRVAKDKKKVIYEKEAMSFEEFLSNDTDQIKRRARIVCRNLQLMSRMKEVLNPLAFGFFSIKFWSHKMLRWLVPFFLIFLLVINICLLKYGIFYQVFLFIQIGFYLCALIFPIIKEVFLVNKLKKIFYIPYFFCFSNLGIFLGFLYYFSGKKYQTWVPQRT